jgi:hypothetical protein
MKSALRIAAVVGLAGIGIAVLAGSGAVARATGPAQLYGSRAR